MSQSLEEIDEAPGPEGGHLTSDARLGVIYGTSAVVLLLMSYATIDVSVQVGASEWLVVTIASLSPALDTWLFPYRGLVGPLVWAMGCVVCYFVIPALVVRTVLGHRLVDYGLRWEGFSPSIRLFLALYLPLAIVVILVAQTPAFQQYYPFYRDAIGVGDFAVWALLYGLQFFALEFFFRGFLCHGVRDVLGRHAIMVMVIPYVMIHFPKPLFEACGALGAGLILGFLSLRTGSIALGVALHVAVAWTMDIAALLSKS